MEFNIESPTINFGRHLSLVDNDRIIFSGKFGTGKTYFLNKFFKEKDEYDVIHLFPVNYSVSSNKDIFELIKYDILFELLRKDVEFDKINIPHTFTFLEYANKHGHNILAPFLSLLPIIGKDLYTIYTNLDKLSKDYLEKHDAAQVDDKKEVLEYLKGFSQTQGSIYEEDFFTQLINQLVCQLKTYESNKKQTILIIDDLDRIDPDHIFRILNVLAAHCDKDSQNKFGFDKIILVCDIENIRSIFRNRFGARVDFSGYIDKFYSKKIFDFNNSDGLCQQIAELLASTKQNTKPENFDLQKTSDNTIKHLTYVIMAMIKSNNLSIRSLLKVANTEFHQREYRLDFKTNNIYAFNLHVDSINLIEYLLFLFEDIDQLIEVVEATKDFKTSLFGEGYRIIFCGQLLAILDHKNHNFREFDSITYTNESTKQYFEYSSRVGGQAHDKTFFTAHKALDTSNKTTLTNNQINYFGLLLDFVKTVKKENLLEY